MNNADKIAKEVKLVMDSTKDVVVRNLMLAVNNKGIEVDASQLPKLLAFVNASFDEGYQKALPNLQKSIKKHLSE